MKHNNAADIIFLIISAIILTAVIYIILRLLFKIILTIYLRKNADRLISSNKAFLTKCQKLGEEIASSYDTYLGYIANLKLNKTINCSSSVLNNVDNDPIKYVIKYSNINIDITDVEHLDFISNFLNEYDSFIFKMQKAGYLIKMHLPFLLRWPMKAIRISFIVCNVPNKLLKIEKPFLRFLYTSPAGKTSRDYKINIGKNEIAAIEEIIYRKIGKKGHSKAQRSAMTNDLREAIKKRDNYTCCICGNSVYKEPNLLLEVDHIIPISKGGKTEASNLQTLCWRCNRSKRDK